MQSSIDQLATELTALQDSSSENLSAKLVEILKIRSENTALTDQIDSLQTQISALETENSQKDGQIRQLESSQEILKKA
jgi:cell division protein FtsL